MPYKITQTPLSDVLILESTIFRDSRGFFLESYNQNDFNEVTGLNVSFVQDNHSQSKQGVLRGLHFQTGNQQQGKLVRVVRGEIYDVVVNVQPRHKEYGKWFGIHLIDSKNQQLWVPEGFAHGFLVLSPNADVVYKTTKYYSSEYEKSILWNDPDLAIQWPAQTTPILSEKDMNASLFKNISTTE